MKTCRMWRGSLSIDTLYRREGPQVTSSSTGPARTLLRCMPYVPPYEVCAVQGRSPGGDMSCQRVWVTCRENEAARVFTRYRARRNESGRGDGRDGSTRGHTWRGCGTAPRWGLLDARRGSFLSLRRCQSPEVTAMDWEELAGMRYPISCAS